MYNKPMKKKIPNIVIGRLTLYHFILRDYLSEGAEYISSGQIAKLLNIDDSQVRKDLNLLKNSGKNRIGYPVKALKDSIEQTLGFAKTKRAIIIGAGNLGMALAKYDNFQNYGLSITCLFDTDPKIVGAEINNKKIYDMKELPVYIWKEFPDIAILTVPSSQAQKSAQYLVNLGIKYIWNFTPVVLDVPENVQVWNENITGNFLQFSYGIQ